MTKSGEFSVTRRSMLSAAATGASAAALGASPAMAQTRKTFVLIHGAWHGGWCWRRVADLLERQGHKVFAPSLTGLADRSHLLSKDITLDTHVADIVNLFRWEEIKDACMAVHSYGGWPGSAAVEQIGDRVSSIVFVDAFIPEDGQRGADSLSPPNRKVLDEALAKGELGRRSPTAAAFRVNEKDRAWVDSKTTPQPISIPLQPIKLTGAREKIARKAYVRAVEYPQPTFDKALARCKADKTWQTFELKGCGHDIMVDAPAALADVLLKVS
jgi:pimeloyl-ACP methyl ester carboxylesterase